MPRIRSLTAAGFAVAALACAGEPVTGPITSLPRPLTSAESRLVQSGNSFTLALFREALHQEDPADNVFVSPLSVSMAFGMVLNGAAGVTESSMQRALALDGMTRDEINASYRGLIDLLRGLDPHVTFTIANSIWYREPFTPPAAFLETNRTYFDAEVRGLDFTSPSAAPTINSWVNSATAGRIPEIVPDPLSRNAIMYLVNAIYFKATWTTRFDKSRTESGPFHLAGGGSVPVPMMRTDGPIPVRGGYRDGTAALDLPYGGGAYSMLILLPGTGMSVDSLAAGLTSADWSAWVAALDSTRIEVVMPRFTLRYDLDSAIPVLRQLGMTATFCDEGDPRTDFTRLYAGGGACVSKVKHKTFVLVDEAGTEAAAATSVEIGLTSAPAAFVVDRPFIFALRERLSGTILFIGRVMNPSLDH
jgi:serine protease inhibitor